MRPFASALLLLVAGCATTPHAWQNPGTGALASADEITTCRIEADREAQRSVFLYGWGGAGYPLAWRRGFVPGWGWGWGSPGLAMAQRSQELANFCMRVKGFQWLPLAPATTPPADAKPDEEKPAP